MPQHSSKKSTPPPPQSDFGNLLIAEIPRLRRYARALTRDVSRADDLVQGCMVRAINKQHLWQPGTNLRAWLFTILHNQYVNEVRRSVRDGVSVPVDGMADELVNHTDKPDSRILIRDLENCLDQLPEDQRRTIILVGYYGLSYERVADYEKVPVGTIRSRLSRGREMLTSLFEGSTISQEDRDILETWGRA